MSESTERAPANYTILSQSRDEVGIVANSPSVSMWPHLLASDQPKRLNSISIYADRGTSRDQTRVLYMNATALAIWREMGHTCTIIGSSHRPPRSATLAFGMPFSE